MPNTPIWTSEVYAHCPLTPKYELYTVAEAWMEQLDTNERHPSSIAPEGAMNVKRDCLSV